tara:strand:+ start:2049 stop:2300 length:252 start_codon:yes stop_codon:yes gene_type:complete
METVDNRDAIFKLEEIYKYKDLIESSDRDLIKSIIFKNGEESTKLHQEFLRLVGQEVDHKLNKEEFKVLKDQLMREMKKFLEN